MVTRLGQVLYWLGCGLAAACLAGGALVAYSEPTIRVVLIAVSAVLAVICFGIGRALLYILAAR